MSAAVNAGNRPEPQSWEARHAVAANVFTPWLDRIYPLTGKRVLEYGSGLGCASCAIGERAGSLIGYDIEPGSVAESRRRANERGLDHLQFEALPADRIFAGVREHSGEIDVFLLYAVLEHLTVRERLEALRIAREVVREDGVVVVIETPNRLVDTDYHTSMLPFFDQLPEELALEYLDRSPRSEFRDQMIGARRSDDDGGALALARWGTGVSFHEFELVFGDLRRHVVAGGYAPELLGERTIHGDELALARYLHRVRPDLPPPFSRFWLDLVISPRPVDPATWKMISPWPVETDSSEAAKLTVWDTVALGPGERLTIHPPVPVERVVCVLAVPTPRARLTVRDGRRRARVSVEGEPSYPLVADVMLGRLVDQFTIEVNEPAHIQFVGYEMAGPHLPADD